jgi:diaminopimelate epimerase
MCGNAIRCLGKYLYDRGNTKKQEINVQTLRGIIPCILMVRDGRVYRVKADMGEPILERAKIRWSAQQAKKRKKSSKKKSTSKTITRLSSWRCLWVTLTL